VPRQDGIDDTLEEKVRVLGDQIEIERRDVRAEVFQGLEEAA
jgi:hypothetical protein